MFATQKKTVEPVSFSTQTALDKIKAQEPGAQILVVQIEKIEKIFSFLDRKKSILKAQPDLSFELQKLQSSTLAQILQKYEALPVDYRQTVVLKEDKTAQKILLEQLQNIEYVLVDMINVVLESDRKEFLVEAQYIENKTKNSQKETLEDLSEHNAIAASITATPSTPTAHTVSTITQELAATGKELEKGFVFYERPDLDNTQKGQQNIKILVILGVVVVVILALGLILV